MNDVSQNGNPYQLTSTSGEGPRRGWRRWKYLVALLLWVPISLVLGFMLSIRIHAWPQFTAENVRGGIDPQFVFYLGIIYGFILYIVGRIVLGRLAKRSLAARDQTPLS